MVTGAGGFVGANLVRRLLAAGDDVGAISRASQPGWRLEDVAGEIRLMPADLRDAEATARAVRAIRPERIFHLAAHGGYSWERDRRKILETNLFGTVKLLEACLDQGFECFVHAGSSSEYGFKTHAPSEDEAPEPNSDYAVGKASATLFCGYIARAHNVHVVTLRLYSVYGTWEEPNRLVPTLLVNGMEGTLPSLVDRNIARDFVFVDDVCDAIAAAASATNTPRGALYNVGTGSQTTIEEIVTVARELLGIEAEPVWGDMPSRTWDSTTWVAEVERIRRDLGWQSRTSLREGLERTVRWLHEHPEFLVRYRREIPPKHAV